jgi:hypothetical protein
VLQWNVECATFTRAGERGTQPQLAHLDDLLLFMLTLVSFGLTNFETILGLYAAEKFGYGFIR